MNRGSPVSLALMPTCYAGFNEAPIHESGKWHWLRSPFSRLGRFNEAPIHESGK